MGFALDHVQAIQVKVAQELNPFFTSPHHSILCILRVKTRCVATLFHRSGVSTGVLNSNRSRDLISCAPLSFRERMDGKKVEFH
jgi:hypothetical protein